MRVVTLVFIVKKHEVALKTLRQSYLQAEEDFRIKKTQTVFSTYPYGYLIIRKSKRKMKWRTQCTNAVRRTLMVHQILVRIVRPSFNFDWPPSVDRQLKKLKQKMFCKSPNMTLTSIYLALFPFYILHIIFYMLLQYVSLHLIGPNSKRISTFDVLVSILKVYCLTHFLTLQILNICSFSTFSSSCSRIFILKVWEKSMFCSLKVYTIYACNNRIHFSNQKSRPSVSEYKILLKLKNMLINVLN